MGDRALRSFALRAPFCHSLAALLKGITLTRWSVGYRVREAGPQGGRFALLLPIPGT